MAEHGAFTLESSFCSGSIREEYSQQEGVVTPSCGLSVLEEADGILVYECQQKICLTESSKWLKHFTRILCLKAILMAAYLLVLFAELRMFQMLTWYRYSLSSTDWKSASVSVRQCKEVLEFRGVNMDEVLEKEELYRLMKTSGVTMTEVESVKELQAAAAAVVAADNVTVFVKRSDYVRMAEVENKITWLVKVDASGNTRAQSVSIKTWQDVKHKMVLLNISTAILDCQSHERWCKERDWTSPRLQLSLPNVHSEKPEVVGYRGPFTLQNIYTWVLDNLHRKVRRVRTQRDLRSDWLTFRDPLQQPELRVLLFTDRQSPPPFYSVLSMLLEGKVKFGWVQAQTSQELLDLTTGTDLLDPLLARLESSPGRSDIKPLIIVASHDGVYLYGDREEECFSLLCLRNLVSNFRPSQNALFSFTILLSLSMAALNFYVYKDSLLRRVLLNAVTYLAMTVSAWLLVTRVQDLRFSQPWFTCLLRLSRYAAMTTAGAWLRHDTLVICRHWMTLIPLSLVLAHCLLKAVKVKAVGEEFDGSEDLSEDEEEVEEEPEEEEEVPIEAQRLALRPEVIDRLNEFFNQLVQEDMDRPPVHDVDGLPEWRHNTENAVPEGYNQEDSCSICLDNYGDGDLMTGLRCRHTFHYNCLVNWLNTGRSHTCPLCRH